MRTRRGAYVLAVTIAVVAAVATGTSSLLAARVPFLLGIAAVMLSAWYGGGRAGALTAAIVALSHWYAVLPPRFEFDLARREMFLLTGFLAVSLMISALVESQRRAQWLHRRSEERYRSFLTNSTEAIWRFEIDEPVPTSLPADEQVDRFFDLAYLAECNAALAKMYGYATPDELRGLRLREMLLPDDAANREYLRAFVRHNYRLSSWESHEVDREGRHKYFLNNLTGVVEQGHLVRVWGTQLDITERKVTEAERERLFAREKFLADASATLAGSLDYETTVRNAAHLVVPSFADWCVVDARTESGDVRRLAAAYARPDGDEIARAVMQFPPSADHPEQLPARALFRGEVLFFPEFRPEVMETGVRDARHRGVVQQINPQSLIVLPMIARGEAFGAIMFAYAESGRRYSENDLSLAQELTARFAQAIDNARLYRQAQQANRLKDEFLATLSHELRTPLNAIVGWARLLGSGQGDPTRAIEAIQRNADAQTRIVEEVLDSSAIVTGRLKLHPSPVHVPDLIEHALDAVRAAADAKDQRLDWRVLDDPGPVMVDPDRVRQIVWNLLTNAVKFTPEAGSIAIELSAKGEQFAIVVRDDGEGITPEFLPYVFERFRQGDSSMTRRFGGLGLGLSIAKHLAEAHGGTIDAASDGPGRGATFVVRLPIRRPPTSAVLEPGRDHALK